MLLYSLVNCRYTAKIAEPVQGCWKQHWTMFCCTHCSTLSTILSKSGDYKERQVDRKKRKVFVTAHVILRTAAMFLASALNRGSTPPGNIERALANNMAPTTNQWGVLTKHWRMLTNHWTNHLTLFWLNISLFVVSTLWYCSALLHLIVG